MGMRRRLLTAASLAFAPIGAWACCGVVPAGAAVHFAGQTNIVVWDEAHGMEHFVRDARFETDAKNLGFIAPTPTRPQLSEVDKNAFAILAKLSPPIPLAGSRGMKDGGGPPPPVQVVQVTDVAGYRATVLKANDANALAAWLKKNGYGSPSWLPKWLSPYVKRSWYLTAFKVSSKGAAGTGPVRLSFKTDRPFNPYAVPSANSGRGSLQLFYVSSGDEVPKIGGTKGWIKPHWRADVPERSRIDLARALHLPTSAVPRGASVVAYVDDRFSTPNQDDLYFVEAQPRTNTKDGLLFLIGAGVVAGAILSIRGRFRGQ